jgi:hypothetical protein
MPVMYESMQRHHIKRNFEPVVDLGFKNLVVGGCSFTHTYSKSTGPTTWPYYLRDLASIREVFSCAMPGAGNYFISQSVIWGLETKKLPTDETLVIVMWSGHDREDEIFSSDAIDSDSNFVYQFTDKVCHGIPGAPTRNGDGNTQWFGYRDIYKFKSVESRAVENAVWKIGLKGYLDALGYQSIFVNFLDPAFPNRTNDFDIVKFLPDTVKTTYNSIIDPVQDIYSFCLKRMLLGDDNFHPSPNGHLAWARDALLPYCKNKFNKQ